MSDKEKHTILVVDDAPAYIDVLRHILVPTYAVKPATDGRSAIKMAEKYNPDLILLDAIMPHMSGFEALAALKESEVTKNIPVIILSGLSDSNDEVKGLRLGAADYIRKPFNDDIVALRVKMQLKILEQTRALERLALIDALTNLPNRRSAENQLYTNWNKSIREHDPLSNLMIDIDQFKNFNDCYGYACGNEALNMVANAISQTMNRINSFIARWDSDAFFALLPNTKSGDAMEVAERIRHNVADIAVPLTDNQVTGLTVSIGVSSVIPDLSLSIEHFISQAEESLRAAKNAGRNNVQALYNPV